LFHLRQADQVLRTTAALLVIGGFLVGASSVGADWQAGLMATVLTWESRRWRVAGARLIALVTGVLVVSVAWEVLLTVALVPYAALRHTADGTGAEWLRMITGLGTRIAVVAAGAGAVGFALALVGRGTAIALGSGFAYVFVFENVVGSQFKPLRAWMLLWNAIVFAKGRFEAGGDVPGRSVLAAGALLAVYLAAIVGGAMAVFRRRDLA
jgi:ABC-2 type transport system permease protein